MKSEYLINKYKVLESFNIDAKSCNIINDFIKYLKKETLFHENIIDHVFNSIVVILNYNKNNIFVIKNLFAALKECERVLIMELSEQLNQFVNYEYNDDYDSIIFETFYFIQVFNDENNLKASINILHEIIFNISRINDKLDQDIKTKIYIEILNDITKKLKGNKTNKNIYLSTVEVCNMTVRLLNDWIE